jgi:transcriptional regulator with XRE-family HTH domain
MMTNGQSTPEQAAVLRVIWELQEEVGVSAAELARESHLGRMYVHRRLHGEVGFSVEDLLHLAQPLGVTHDELLARVTRALDALG